MYLNVFSLDFFKSQTLWRNHDGGRLYQEAYIKGDDIRYESGPKLGQSGLNDLQVVHIDL